MTSKYCLISVRRDARKCNWARLLCLLVTTATVELPLSPSKAAIFADFTDINSSPQTAVGQLDGIAFSLISTRAVLRPAVGDSGIIGGLTNGTSNAFGLAVFNPRQALGDDVGLGAASDFRLSFASSVSDITLHIYQLESNELSFTSNGDPIPFTIVSSDNNFTTFGGNTTIQGSPGAGDDANGSLKFAGTFSELSWTAAPAVGNTLNDGIRLQFSVGPELAGDYNNNGIVDAADYTLWRKNNNTAVTLPNDSTPGTSAGDYDVWRAHFGRTNGNGAGAIAESSSAPVPEPATLGLLYLAVAGWCLRRGSPA
jgi:PEP-CTERM motif